ncbi:hypothetical protein [Chryseobacterium sp. JK1]|uniref:hypothetical protein n=1 Tax=Chryseobacterium sp. JK1 TaxID=874294 RepID=UPI003D6847DF
MENKKSKKFWEKLEILKNQSCCSTQSEPKTKSIPQKSNDTEEIPEPWRVKQLKNNNNCCG